MGNSSEKQSKLNPQDQNIPSKQMGGQVHVNMQSQQIMKQPNTQEYVVITSAVIQNIEQFVEKEDPITEYVKNADHKNQDQLSMLEIQKSIDFQLVARQNQIQVSNNKTITLPVMISLITKQLEGEKKRSPIDLICVIDDSGSMSGQKAQLVRKSLKFLLKVLNSEDRICLISFDTRTTILTPFLRNDEKNKAQLKNGIAHIQGRGGTHIHEGVENALWMLQNRKQKNPISCLFLLTDGQDGFTTMHNNKSTTCLQRVQSLINKYKFDKNQLPLQYTINCYGYGTDHDPDLMNQIAQTKQGKFYFIKELNQISEWFVLSLSGILTVLAEKVQIFANPTIKNYQITQRYGGDKIWTQDNTIAIPHLVQGATKEYFFDIEIPVMPKKIEDHQRCQKIALGTLLCEIIDGHQPLEIKSNLEITLMNPDEESKDNEILQNEQFEVGYLRIKGAQMIEQACELSKQQKYEEGEKLLKNFLQNEIEKSQFKDKQGVLFIKSDILKTIEVCKPKLFEQEGKAFMYKKCNDHIQRNASICNLADWDDNQVDMMNQYNANQMCLSDDSCGENDSGSLKQVRAIRKNSMILKNSESDDDGNGSLIMPNRRNSDISIGTPKLQLQHSNQSQNSDDQSNIRNIPVTKQKQQPQMNQKFSPRSQNSDHSNKSAPKIKKSFQEDSDEEVQEQQKQNQNGRKASIERIFDEEPQQSNQESMQ